MVNYGSSPFDKLTAAPYVSQYVGNTLDAEKATFDRLQTRYDAGETLQNQISKIAKAIPLAPEEEYLRTGVESYYNDLLKSYAERGDYHRLLPKIQSEAATIESLYKNATSRYEAIQKQKEAIMKTKASDNVKNMFVKNKLLTGESRYEPGLGFQFGNLNTALPTDAQDIPKYVLDMAEKVKTFTQSISKYASRAETQRKLEELGVTADEALLDIVIGSSTRDPKLVKEAIYASLLKNPEMMQFMAQENEARVIDLSTEAVDKALLDLKVTPEVLNSLDEETKRSLLTEELVKSEVNGYISFGVNMKAGTLSYNSNETLSNLGSSTSSGGGGIGGSVPGVAFTGDGKSIIQESFNLEDFMSEYAKTTGALKGDPSKLTPEQRARLKTKLENQGTMFTGLMRGFVNSTEYKELISELPTAATFRQQGKSANNTKLTQALDKVYALAREAGITILDTIPEMPAAKSGAYANQKIKNYRGALDRVLYAAKPEWFEKGKGTKAQREFADAVDELFSKNGITEKAEASFTKNQPTISLAPRTLEGGLFDKISTHMTNVVKANQDNFALVSEVDGMGNPVSGESLTTYLKELKATKGDEVDIDNFRIVELEKDPLATDNSFAVVVPGKNGEGRHVRIIHSKNSVPMQERTLLYAETVRDLEKKKVASGTYGEPLFQNISQERTYQAAKSALVNTVYYDVHQALVNFRSSGETSSRLTVPIIHPEVVGKNMQVNFIKEIDPLDPEGDDYIYKAQVLDQDGGTVNKVLVSSTVQDLLYNVYNFSTSLKADEPTK